MVASAKGRRAQGVGGADSKWKLDAHSKITQVDKSDNFVATKTGQHTDAHTHTHIRTGRNSQVPATGIGTRSRTQTGDGETGIETETETVPCAQPGCMINVALITCAVKSSSSSSSSLLLVVSSMCMLGWITIII